MWYIFHTQSPWIFSFGISCHSPFSQSSEWKSFLFMVGLKVAVSMRKFICHPISYPPPGSMNFLPVVVIIVVVVVCLSRHTAINNNNTSFVVTGFALLLPFRHKLYKHFNIQTHAPNTLQYHTTEHMHLLLLLLLALPNTFLCSLH